jgi:hypothetical protein
MNLITNLQIAVDMAQQTADDNGAPVGVATRDGWYRLIEDADVWEFAPEVGWAHAALVNPRDVEAES